MGGGKAMVATRRNRRRRRVLDPAGFMAAVRRASPIVARAPVVVRLTSLVVHPARTSAAPDANSFRHQVQSRRQREGRRGHARAVKAHCGAVRPVPPNLVGLCFNCLASYHVKVDCRFLARHAP